MAALQWSSDPLSSHSPLDSRPLWLPRMEPTQWQKKSPCGSERAQLCLGCSIHYRPFIRYSGGERLSAKVQQDKTGLRWILMTAECFHHTALSSCIPAMFSCCHTAVEMERFIKRCGAVCLATARLDLQPVSEIEFFIVMTRSSNPACVMLSLVFLQHTTPRYPDSAERVTWQRLVILKAFRDAVRLHLSNPTCLCREH